MIVISNASPLIALSQVGVLHILRDLFQSVLIPDAVYHETVIGCHIITQKSAIERALEISFKWHLPALGGAFRETSARVRPEFSTLRLNIAQIYC